jgi:hypothetical protein
MAAPAAMAALANRGAALPQNLKLQGPRTGKVRSYNYQTSRFEGEDPKVPFLSGPQLEQHLIDTYGHKRSSAVRAYMHDNNIHILDVYKDLGITPGRLSATQVRAILTDDALRPWFGPTTEDGFREGIREIQDKWEPLIGTTVPVDSGSGEWFNLQDPDTSDAYTLKTIAQGAQIPVAIITVAKQQIVLEKKGRGIQWTYEAQRAPISLAQLWMRVMGIRIGRSYLGLLAVRAVNGYLDDNTDDPILMNTATGHVFTFEDLLTASLTLREVYGFEATDILLSLNAFIDLLVMQWPTSGNLVFPNGIASMRELLMVQDVHIVNALSDEQIVFMNRSAGLIRYVSDEFATEDDRVVGQQLLATYGTQTDQITMGIKNAVLILNANHA